MSVENTQTGSAIPKWLWLILGITFIVYARMLNADFVNFDDDVMVFENPLITSLSGENVKTYFTQPVSGVYQPLTILSLSIDHAIAGMSPKYFHFINVLLHLINVLLVFKLVKSLSKNEFIGLTVAALFGVHGLHVESVAWINARKDVLFGMFYLLGLIKFLKFTDEKDKKQLIYAFIFFLAACLSKPIAVSFTLILPLIHYYRGEGMKEWLKGRNWMVYLPFAATSLFFGVMIYLDQKENIPDNNEMFQGWGRQIVFAGDAITSYLGRTILPVNLSVIYNYPAAKGEAIPIFTLVKAFIALVFIITTFWLLFKNKGLAFGGLFFLANIVFVLQLVPMGVGYQADRFMYIPILGLFWMIAVGMHALIGSKKLPLSSAKYGLGFYVGILGILTLVRTGDWKDSLSLWNATIKVNPDSYIAYNNRGEIYMEMKQWQDAINDFDLSLALGENAKAYYNRGTSYANQMNWKNAEPDLVKSIELDPMFGEAYGNLGVVYMSTLKDSQALECFHKAIELEPDNPMHQSNLELLKSYMP